MTHYTRDLTTKDFATVCHPRIIKWCVTQTFVAQRVCRPNVRICLERICKKGEFYHLYARS